MATEVWFRNPEYYIREVIEIMAPQIAWDRGYLVKRNLDPTRFADLYYPTSFEYRALVIGHQGTAELRRGHSLANPYAVYPTWQYGQDDLAMLEELLGNPVGETSACRDESIPPDERPVAGQEHRVVITEIPSLSTGVGRRFARILSELQEEYDEASIHLHALYSFRIMFGMNFKSVDVEPKTRAQKGHVMMPYGKSISYEFAAAQPQWVRAVGFSTAQLTEPRERCMFNMKSAMWAAEHWKENFKFRANGTATVDPHAEVHVAATTKSAMSRRLPVTSGDKVVCDLCSLQVSCKYFREGSVCSLPESEARGLAGLFGSRNTDKIIDGLSAILSKQGERAERALETEEAIGDVDDNVTRLLNSTFANGVKLAKLLNPKLGGIQVNLNAPSPAPQRLMSEAIRQLEAQGYARDEITPELVSRVLGVAPAELESAPVDAEVIDAS